jgi:lipopolysaccharide export system protein LptA
MVLAGDGTDAKLPRKKIAATSLLPDGSQLKGVMLPRYDENRKLVGVLKAEAMTLMSENQIAGANVSVEFFNANETSRGRIDLKQAIFYNDQGILVAREPVEIKSDRLLAAGNGLYYSFDENRGFLLGKTTTTITARPEMTMNSTHPRLRATALIGMSLATQNIDAAPPPEINAVEKAAIQADAVPMAPRADAASQEARITLAKDLEDSVAASSAAQSFLVQADLPATPAGSIPAPNKPLDIKSGVNDTVINCEGGMYFDPDEGVFVYMKNVTVKDPRFNLSGANEVKIFFGKKPAKNTSKPTENKKSDTSKIGGNIGANLGDVERIVATGAVLIEQKATSGDKEPIKASGAIFTYHIKEDQITISGGFPWVLQGSRYMRAKEADLTLRISPKENTFITRGNWETGGNLEQKK